MAARSTSAIVLPGRYTTSPSGAGSPSTPREPSRVAFVQLGELGDEAQYQGRDVGLAHPQGRECDVPQVETIERLVAQPAERRFFLERLGRGSGDPHVHLDSQRAAHPEKA